MKTASLVLLGLLGSLAWALEEEEHSLEKEEYVVDSLRQFAGDAKFHSFVHHLGTPAMHAKIEDGKSIGAYWITSGASAIFSACAQAGKMNIL